MNYTKLAPYDAYKDSGFEWLGYVPTHWKGGRIKDFVNTNAVTQVPASMTDSDMVEFIPMSNIDDVLGSVDVLPMR